LGPLGVHPKLSTPRACRSTGHGVEALNHETWRPLWGAALFALRRMTVNALLGPADYGLVGAVE